MEAFLAVIANLGKVGQLLATLLPVLQEVMDLLKNAVPGSAVFTLVAEGEKVAAHVGPLQQVLADLQAAIDAHKAQAQPPVTTS